MFKGSWIIVYNDTDPQWHVLTQEQVAFFLSRCGVVGYDKARHYTFGKSAEHVLAVETADAAASIAEHYDGIYKDRVCGLAACIATNTPINPDSDPPSGGLKVEADRPLPVKPRGGGKAKQLSPIQALMQGS